MRLASAASLYDVVLAIHIMAVVVAFGVTFAYPVMFAVGAKQDPRSLPVLHRIEYTIERTLINGGLVVVVVAGVFLASDGDHWSEFFVQWGLTAAIVIGGLVGAVMIPTAKRAEQLATRDIAAAGDGTIEMSDEYRAAVRRLSTVGPLLSVLVLVTIAIMAIQP
ncbi:MAG TPA: hypothetical protein VGX72_02600 [Solirubrobacteraceae bacterium]|jgi:hypothetical protein|nr:hypothetical protein [Solirubrobacteraceae bacterium]